jgi:hypothetical protein
VTEKSSRHASFIRLSAPKKGHVVARAAERIGGPLRDAVQHLIYSLSDDAYEELSGVPPSEPSSRRSPAELAAWHIAARWLTSVALGEVSSDQPLTAALRWFSPDSADIGIIERLTGSRLHGIEKSLRQAAANAKAIGDLIPYAFDPHGPGSRLSVRRDPTTVASRKRKRSEGVFYTPSDVADYMVGLAVKHLTPCHPITFLDPACGTGVYLRAALAALQRFHPTGEPLSLARQSLFGVDIDPWAVDAAAYVLTHDILATSDSSASPVEILSSMRENFSVQDALLIDNDDSPPSPGRHALGDIFPRLAGGARIVLGNPPYAALGARSDLRSIAEKFSTMPAPAKAADVHPLFVEQMVRLSAEAASGSMVIPLSIAFNTREQFCALRRLVETVGGEWRFGFFDREPHALFGEDVKTRNAIVSWSRTSKHEPSRIFTGKLQKWRGLSRPRLFQTITFTQLHRSIAEGIPKLQDDLQVRAFETLQAHSTRLGSRLEGIRGRKLAQAYQEEEPTVFVGGTAYNFVNTFQRPPSWTKPEGWLTENTLNAVGCASEEDANAIYALLSSRVAFWLWHVMGDGFHVTRRFIEELPLGGILDDAERWARLSELGADMWRRARCEPLVSRNAGRTSVAFPNRQLQVNEVDALVLSAANVDAKWHSRLRDFVNDVVGAHLSTTPSYLEAEKA